MKELASHLGGWSILMRQRQGNLQEEEHPILTMVSYTSKLLFIFAFHNDNQNIAQRACVVYGNYSALYDSALF